MYESSFFQTGPIAPTAITGHYNFLLVALSYVIAVLASYVALELAGNLRKEKRVFSWKLFAGAFAMGAGIFTMHFIGMEAFIMPMPMSYDLSLTLLSLVVAIVASGFALVLVKHAQLGLHRLFFGAVVLGLAIASMHYIGMMAMTNMVIQYRLSLFSLSLLIAVSASFAALSLMLQCNMGSVVRQRTFKIFSALVMGAGIAGMHYTGMAAAVFFPLDSYGAMPQSFIQMSAEKLSFLLAFVASMIMIVTLLTSDYKHSILVKVLMGYFIVTVLTIPLGIISIQNVKTITASFESITNVLFPELRILLEMKNAANQIENTNSRLGLSSSSEGVSSLKEKLATEWLEWNQWINQYQDLKAENPVLAKRINEMQSEVAVASNALIQALENRETSFTVAEKRKKLDQAQNNWEEYLQFLISSESQKLTDQQKFSQAFSKQTFLFSLLMMGLVILFSITVGLLLSYQILKPIFLLKNSAQEIAKGNFTKRVAIQSQDEIGQLANSFNTMVDSLADANKNRKEFISKTVEEFKKPLSTILASNSILTTEVKKKLTPDELKLVDMVNDASVAMLGTIEQLLTVNNIYCGKVEIKKQEIDIPQFSNEIQYFNLLLANKKDIKLVIENKLQQRKAYFDHDKIEQVINTLLNNAFKYSKPHSTTKLVFKGNEHSLRVEVQDEGEGIPEKEQAKIRARFARPMGEAPPEGSEHGLGLEACKNIIQAHEGSIGFQTLPGKGSLFYFEIDTKEH